MEAKATITWEEYFHLGVTEDTSGIRGTFLHRRRVLNSLLNGGSAEAGVGKGGAIAIINLS